LGPAPEPYLTIPSVKVQFKKPDLGVLITVKCKCAIGFQGKVSGLNCMFTIESLVEALK
jgi:hypothetical protein